uniref:Bifunctional inhibitor/plant lipid transfer protein/seed storage helical domain-containing protein n=1 Tax=Lotus japonicus TaxID=34305 RepID=I3STZ3_LOTJA|nr:unknown [Lotus japonicus]
MAKVHWLVATTLLVALLLGGAQKAVSLCGIDSPKQLDLCREAITGKYPPKPKEKCCAVIRHANLTCLCGYKSLLPSVGISPTNALALPRKCGLKTPRQCKVA